MHASAELQVIPVGETVSLRKQVNRVVELLDKSGIKHQPHAFGTDIEGNLQDILDVVNTIHSTLHSEGSVRLMSTLKLETRTDKPSTLAGKQL